MNSMLTIQPMPEIWGEGSFWISRSEVLGQLAHWGVRQSPYTMPENLAQALTEFDAVFHVDSPDGEYLETTCDDLRQDVRSAFERCPQILAWSEPKKGNHTVAFCSRFDQPDPDYDFIDLNALARNVAHSITLASKYDQAQDKHREKVS